MMPDRSPTTARFHTGQRAAVTSWRRALQRPAFAWTSVRSPRLVVQIVAHWLLILSLLSTFLLIAVDHHGAERIPTHRHFGTESSLPTAHLHGFEMTHRHDGQPLPVQASALLVTANDASPQGVELLAFTACMMIVFWLLALTPVSRQTMPGRLTAQLVRHPEVPPPNR